ncbi:MAG: hypothetical protein RBT33_03815 [Candidatus Dojkabacteria bacterium]|jgi:hypothetical protein|nr:hypothetical protein [Candidatus Dojkabacteria bacterium]
MTTPQLKEHFLVVDKLPTVDEFKKAGYLYALPIKEGTKELWILFRDKREVQIYEYLKAPDDYKTKERIFNADIEGYSYVLDSVGNPEYIELQLSKKWLIEDRNIKRELEVIVSDLDQENDLLLHTLYSKTREKNNT